MNRKQSSGSDTVAAKGNISFIVLQIYLYPYAKIFQDAPSATRRNVTLVRQRRILNANGDPSQMARSPL